MDGYCEPHPTMNWLVQAFFRLHRRRKHTEYGPDPIEFTDMVVFAKDVLELPKPLHQLFYRTIEETDEEVRAYLFQQTNDKLEALKNENKLGKKHGRR